MKQTLSLLLIVCLVSMVTSARDKKNLIDQEEFPVGKNLLTNQDIKATKYSFSHAVYQAHIDTLSKTIELQLRKANKRGIWMETEGKLIEHDLSTGTIKWKKDINCLTETIKHFDDLIIYEKGSWGYCLDNKSGEITWKTKSYLLHANLKYNIGLGYHTKAQNETSNTLEGINLNNGSKIWKRKIENDYGWSGLDYINDSTILIVSQGIHIVNIKDGSGWSHKAKTGKIDHTRQIVTGAASAAVGVALGVFTGSYFIVIPPPDIVNHLESNVVIYQDKYVFASADSLYCFNANGGIAWSAKLGRKEATQSELFVKDSVVYMLNLGIAYKNNTVINYGSSSIVAYNYTDGKELFYQPINYDGFDILDYFATGHSIFLLSADSILHCDLSTGAIVGREYLGESLTNFVNKKLYVTDGIKYAPLNNVTGNNLEVQTSKGDVLLMDGGLSVHDSVKWNEMFLPYYRKDGFVFLARDNTTVIINTEGHAVAKLEVPSGGKLIDGRFYAIHRDGFIEVDLRDVLK